MTRATHASSQHRPRATYRRQPGRGRLDAATALGEGLGLVDGVGDGDLLGRIGGGVTVGLVEGVDDDGVGDGEDVVGTGDALPWLLPTCAGGGNVCTA
jgi:hypothetical protein